MEIVFATRQLQKICNNHVQAVKKWGDKNAALLRKILDEMYDSDNLAVFMNLPRVRNSRCHPLTGNLSGKFSIDLKHPYRLIFEPANDPLPTNPEGVLEYKKITIIKILRKENTHGK